jgi:glycosyltransferase involved in cell wall biosynthesis
MEWHAQDLLEALIARGHTVSVLTTPLPNSPALAVLRPNGELVEYGRTPGAYDPFFLASMMGSFPALAARLKPDIIHCQGFAGTLAWMATRKHPLPTLTTVHGTLWSETPLRHGERPKGRLGLHWRYKHRHAFAPLWRRFLRAQHRLAVDSEFTAAELRAEEPRLDCEPTVIPLGFDIGRFPLRSREAARSEWSIREGEVLLASMARLEVAKGGALLLDAFIAVAGERPELRLVLAGEGPERAMLEARAKEAGLSDRIDLPGRLDPRRAAALLAASDCFLNADQGAPAFGLSNAEALVMGVPVIASDRGAHREVVGRDRGSLLLPASDSAAWAEVFRSFATEEDSIRQQRASAARVRFSRDAMAAAYEELYQRVVRDHR